MNPLITLAIFYTAVFYKNGFDIKKPMKADISRKKETKSN